MRAKSSVSPHATNNWRYPSDDNGVDGGESGRDSIKNALNEDIPMAREIMFAGARVVLGDRELPVDCGLGLTELLLSKYRRADQDSGYYESVLQNYWVDQYEPGEFFHLH